MSFKFKNEEGEKKEFTLIPDGELPFEIIAVEEGETKKGDPMVTSICKVIGEKYANRRIWHRVYFLTGNGAGIGKHWLKAIGEPFEGEIEVNPEAWKGKTFIGTVSSEEYVGKDGSDKSKNVITDVQEPEEVQF